MRSVLYVGQVAHERTRPARHRFHYPVYFLGVWLDELEELDSTLRRFGLNRRAMVSLWNEDHGPRDGGPLMPWIESVCSRASIDLTGGTVMLLTFPRVMGARFYPVSFWYCFDRDGSPVAVLAEVQNTYRDRHNYLLHNGGAPFDWDSRPTATKAFYVSPFIQVEDVSHEFAFSPPGDRIAIRIADLLAEPSPLLVASLDLSARPLTDDTLARTVLRHGPPSAVALVRIHWQALRLLLKRVPFLAHTPPPSEELSR